MSGPAGGGGPPADPMTWARASSLLAEAGWELRPRPGGGVALGAAGGPELGALAGAAPAADAEVDGHGLLRAAGGGGLDLALAESVASTDPVDEVVVGLNWTMVRAGGLCGVARSPARGTEGARTVRGAGAIAGRPLRGLAGWLCSLDPLRRSVGLAAVNAFWNRPGGPVARGGWGLARFGPPGDGLVIVGGFRGAAARLPAATVVEREPKGGDVPASRAAGALASASAVAVTAQALMNGSLEPLLALCGDVPVRLLVGPSAPVAAAVLDHGPTAVSGLAVTDAGAVRRFIQETGTMIALDRMTAPLELAR